MQHITPEMVEGAYSFLLTTLPFRNWRMPHPDKIRFRVMVTKERYGHWNGTPEGDTVGELAVSIGTITSTDLLVATVAHEMIHIHQEAEGFRDHHGVHFDRFAKLVCRRHAFDRAEF